MNGAGLLLHAARVLTMDTSRPIAEAVLGIKEGETTADGKVSLRGAQCSGTCALSPMILINGETHGHLRLADVPRLLADLKG